MEIKFFRQQEILTDQQLIIIENLKMFPLTKDQLLRIQKIIDE